MKWQKKLTKKQLAHMHETGATTLAAFKRNREFHHAEAVRLKAEDWPMSTEVCFDCRQIAVRLGMEN